MVTEVCRCKCMCLSMCLCMSVTPEIHSHTDRQKDGHRKRHNKTHIYTISERSENQYCLKCELRARVPESCSNLISPRSRRAFNNIEHLVQHRKTRQSEFSSVRALSRPMRTLESRVHPGPSIVSGNVYIL